MQSKSLLIAIAAFAVTTTGASAFSSIALERANLTDEQRTALEQAHELRKSGDKDAARDLLLEAGIDEEVLHELRSVAHKTRFEIHEAVEAGDYDTFRELVGDSPLADIITSEADFERFREAHELRESGDYEGAKTIFDELGVERGEHHRKHGFMHRGVYSQLTEEQREALRVAKQANDRETVKAILEEAGIERH